MKTHALILAAFAVFTLPTLADSSASILTDYRAKAETALSKVNATLDTESAKISQTLLSLNDTAAVADLAAQVQAKRAGEPVANPVSQAVQLFAAYDRARAAALAPVQEASMRRIETLLASSEGRKTEVVAEMSKVKKEVSSGRLGSKGYAPPPNWTFHKTKAGPPEGQVIFTPDGTATFVSKIGNKTSGKWQKSKLPDAVIVTFPSDEWKVSFRKSATEVRTTTSQEICYLQEIKIAAK